VASIFCDFRAKENLKVGFDKGLVWCLYLFDLNGDAVHISLTKEQALKVAAELNKALGYVDPCVECMEGGCPKE